MREVILSRIEGVDHCASVTSEHLAGIDEELNLNYLGAVRLRSGDFDGLTAVTEL